MTSNGNGLKRRTTLTLTFSHRGIAATKKEKELGVSPCKGAMSLTSGFNRGLQARSSIQKPQRGVTKICSNAPIGARELWSRRSAG